MKLIDILRKLGIFRSGSFSGTYKSGKDMPAELLMDDVYDSKKDLINKKDIEKTKDKKFFQNKNGAKTSKTGRKIFFWIVVFLVVIFLLGNISTGFSFSFLATLIIWLFVINFLRKFAFGGLYSFGFIFFVVIVTFFISLIIFPSSESENQEKNDKSSSENTGVDFEKKVLEVNSAEGDVLGTIGLEKKVDKKTGKETIHATYNLLLKADLPFNSKCGGEEMKTPRCEERYEYSGRLVRSDKKGKERRGNGVAMAVYCNKDELGDPFDTFSEKHTLETCGVNNIDGVLGLETDTFLSSFTVVFSSYQDIMNSNEFELYSFADFWEKIDGEIVSYGGNTDLAVEKGEPIKKFDFVID